MSQDNKNRRVVPSDQEDRKMLLKATCTMAEALADGFKKLPPLPPLPPPTNPEDNNVMEYLKLVSTIFLPFKVLSESIQKQVASFGTSTEIVTLEQQNQQQSYLPKNSVQYSMDNTANVADIPAILPAAVATGSGGFISTNLQQLVSNNDPENHPPNKTPAAGPSTSLDVPNYGENESQMQPQVLRLESDGGGASGSQGEERNPIGRKRLRGDLPSHAEEPPADNRRMTSNEEGRQGGQLDSDDLLSPSWNPIIQQFMSGTSANLPELQSTDLASLQTDDEMPGTSGQFSHSVTNATSAADKNHHEIASSSSGETDATKATENPLNQGRYDVRQTILDSRAARRGSSQRNQRKKQKHNSESRSQSK